MDNLAVRQRLDALIRERGEDYLSLSRLIGRNPAYIQQFIRRGIPRRLSEEDRRTLARRLGASEAELGAPQPVAPSPPEPPAALPPGHRLVPVLTVGASAGPGALPAGEGHEAAFAFPDAFLRTLARGPLERLSIVHVEGDSMAPALNHGDHILVDAGAGAGAPLRDGIHVLRLGGEADALLVKRLALHPAARTIDVLSDNPAYPSHHGLAADQLTVIGRVVWVGRRV